MARAELFEPWAPLPTAVSVAGVLAATTPSGGADPREAGCTWQVVLDAGHGGSDSGAANAKYGVVEEEQTPDVARWLEALLQADGHAVCMARTGDETLSDGDRYAYANAVGAGRTTRPPSS